MILFWLICLGMLVVALVFVLPPALRAETANSKDVNARRDANIAVYRGQLEELEADLRNGIVSQEQYAQDRDDIERRLLEDTGSDSPAVTKSAAKISATTRQHAYLIGIGLSLVVVIFYLRVGTLDAITNAATATTPRPNAPGAGAAAPAASGQRSQAQIEASVTALAERLKENPADVQGWTMLARSYSSMERFAEAAGAYAKATELTPDNADLWAEYAFTSAMASDRKLAGKPAELVQRALKADPENPKALQLAGAAAFEAKDYKKAVSYWERVLAKLPPDDPITQVISERINEAKALSQQKP